MAKRFKLKIYRIITTTWQSCRSSDPSILPEDSVPSFSRLNPNDQNHGGGHRRPSFKHHLSSAVTSIGGACGISTNKKTSNDHHQFKWQKEEKWHVVAKIYELPAHHRQKICSSSEDDLSFSPPAPPPSAVEEKEIRRKKKKKNKKKYNVQSRLRISTSSADSGWFSSECGAAAAAAGDERDYEEETETLVSSTLSFSTDSSSANLPHRRKKRRVPKRTKRGGGVSAEEAEIPARLSMFKKLIPCTVDGKVKESFAIVKRSEDPYEDFKNSMMDMIVEKQMFDRRDLEQLLQCFLSLNSKNYHGIIVQAFTEIWEAIFSRSSGNKPENHRRGISRVASF